MSKSNHTPEPWELEKGWCGGESALFITSKYNDGFRPWTDADARRIVACVNGCADINPDAIQELIQKAIDVYCAWELGGHHMTKVIKELRDAIDKTGKDW